MNEEKWGEIVDLIEQKFGVLEKHEEEAPIGDDFEDDKANEKTESIIFDGPLGRMKIQRIIRPVILDKKVHYSKRIGMRSQVEITYSEDEFTQKMKAFKWDDIDQNWIEIEAGGLKFA